jgi:two-component system sensor histidine kinase SenX3
VTDATSLAWIACVVAVGALVIATVAWLRTRRALRRSLAALSDRIDLTDVHDAPGSVEHVVDQFQRSLEDARESGARAEHDHDRLALAFDAATDGVVVVDARGEVVLRNAAAARFHGARHADALAEEALGELLDRARGGESEVRDLQLFGPPRQVLHVRAHPLVYDHEIVGAAAFVRDVTDSRRVDSVRRDFVANVSHELKTPIGALALLAETIGSGADDVEMTQRLAERVVREADRLGNIVDDLLDLSLIEAQESPTREPFPVPMLIGDAVDQVRPAANVAGVPLQVVVPVADVELVCDRRQVTSAVVNLLENAVKYSDAGAAVEVSARAERGRLCISVSDHGIGIPTRDLERIFERFYRVDRARSRQTGGTGLGLAIVRHVAQAHGGDVRVTSAEGDGSTFTLTLPLTPASWNAAEPRVDADVPARPARVWEAS